MCVPQNRPTPCNGQGRSQVTERALPRENETWAKWSFFSLIWLFSFVVDAVFLGGGWGLRAAPNSHVNFAYVYIRKSHDSFFFWREFRLIIQQHGHSDLTAPSSLCFVSQSGRRLSELTWSFDRSVMNLFCERDCLSAFSIACGYVCFFDQCEDILNCTNSHKACVTVKEQDRATPPYFLLVSLSWRGGGEQLY